VTRVVFLGTPAAAVPTLRAIADQVVLAITRPDRAAGRSRRPRPSPVKIAAEQIGVEVSQPTRAEELAPLFEQAAADVAVVVAFGMLIPSSVLSIPARGFLNVHFSLLPRWRGAAPIERAILAGDQRTGVTVIQLDEGLDTGPIIASRSVALDNEADAASIAGTLAELGADLLAKTLPGYLDGALRPRLQPEEGVTYAKRIDPGEVKIDPASSAQLIDRQIRAFTARGGAYVFHGDERVKVWRARPAPFGDLEPGQLAVTNNRVHFGTGEGALELLEVQASGRKRMDAAAWARGRELVVCR